MTEEEWLQTAERWQMLNHIREPKPSARKTRLWNAAVCRRFWAYLPEASKLLLIESERIADSGGEPRDKWELCHRANAAVAPFDREYPDKQFPDQETRIRRDAAAAVCYAVLPSDLHAAASYFTGIDPNEQPHQVAILRDIFGNPFRPVAFDPAWRTDTAVLLAKQMYESRDFGAMPILADSLQDAGCDSDDILNHCRAETTHVRGCWVVDLVLGKA